MTTDNTNKHLNPKSTKVIIGLCIIAYGMLMGLRSEFDQHWLKNVIAGCAGGFLGCALALLSSQKKK
jgi:hypothetical protein